MDFHFEKTAGLLCSDLIPLDNHGSHGPLGPTARDRTVRWPKCPAQAARPRRMRIKNQDWEIQSQPRSTQNPLSTQWTMLSPLEPVPAPKHCMAASTTRKFLK